LHRLDWTHGPLHYRAFRHALIARVVSAGGSWMQTVAAGWLVYQLTESAAAVGVLTVVSRAPGIALSSVGGQLAQRHDPRRVALVLSFLQVIPAVLLAVVSWLDADTEVAIYLLVLAGSVLGALATAPTAWISSHSVPQEMTKKAVGESSMAYNLARFVGPLLGGGLVTALGAGWCFAINAATYLVMAWAVWTLPRRPMPHEDKPVRFAGAVRRTLAHPLLGVVLPRKHHVRDPGHAGRVARAGHRPPPRGGGARARLPARGPGGRGPHRQRPARLVRPARRSD
jgi:MFS family permease